MPLVDYLEITPKLVISQDERNFLEPAILFELHNVANQVQFIIHGIGPSIASHEGYSEAYLRLVDYLGRYPGTLNRIYPT